MAVVWEQRNKIASPLSMYRSHGTEVDHLGSFLPKISKIAQEMAYFGFLRIMMGDLG